MSTLNQFERNLRWNIRNFLLVASDEQVQKELEISLERGDTLRARFIEEIIVDRSLGD